MAFIAPKLSIFPPSQLALWPELVATPKEFVLYGGTAIALQLGHRVSEDFDFFALRDIDPSQLYNNIPYLYGSKIIQREPNTLTCLVERQGPVKVSFFGVPNLKKLQAPVTVESNGLQIASLIDLAATKMHVVAARSQAKDYLDIDALIHLAGIPLIAQLEAAKAVFGSEFEPTPTLKALSYFGDGDLSTLPRDVQKRLVLAAADCDLAASKQFMKSRIKLKKRGRQI